MKRPLLLPLVPLYAAGVALRELRLERGWEAVRRLNCPVISIGNLSTGGAGKTPVTIALTRLLRENGFQVDVLSRGYGRRSGVAMRVAADGSVEQYGDEPLLMAREAGVPVYVAAERFEAGRLAESEMKGAEVSSATRVHLLDDGFQHRQLARDIDVLLLNREDWHDHLLPAGNLRESRQAAKRASVIAVPAEDAGLEAELRGWGWMGPIWRIRRRMDVPRIDGPVAAFCGIARPEQFFAGLESAGLRVVVKKAFADHHRYSREDVESLLAMAGKANASRVITTGKDSVRLGDLAAAFSGSPTLETAALQVELNDERSVAIWIEEKLAAAYAMRAQMGRFGVSGLPGRV